MSNVEKEMQELHNDLLDVLNKHGLVVMKDSVMLELSPKRIDIKSGLIMRDVTISFREASLLPDDELKANIDKYGLIMETE
jgi:hypothetical protein